MRSVSIKLIAILLFCVAVTSVDSTTVMAQKAGSSRVSRRYVCPMHPDVVSNRPGKCRKCGMKLTIVKEEAPKKTTTSPRNETPVSATDEIGSSKSPRIPDAPVYDQNGNRLNFYTDLVKGKTVAINFIFTTCTAICPSLTATFRRVQQELGDRAGHDIHLISVSVDPVTDVPERLRDYAVKFHAGPGWTFVTGQKPDINSVLSALGAAVSDKNSHTPLILVGNDATGFWTRAYGVSSPTTLAKLITDAADRK